MAKTACDKLDAISITELKRHGLLKGDVSAVLIHESAYERSGTQVRTDLASLRPQLWITREDEASYAVELTTTPCYFGGRRYWFICPLVVDGAFCGKRMGVLYLGGRWFGCRDCYQLSYLSRQRSPSGFFGTLGRFLRFEHRLVQVRAARTRCWKGNVTKRHFRWSKKVDRLSDMAKTLIHH